MSTSALDVVTISDTSKLVSEYKKRYKQHPLPVRESFKPSQEPMHSDAIVDDLTTSRKDYIAHKIERTSPIKPDNSYQKPQEKFQMTSSYVDEYSGMPGERVRPIKREDNRPDLGKFVGEATYTNDYPKWKLPERYVKEKESWSAPEEGFNGQTTSRSDYPTHQLSPRETYKPSNAYVKPVDPFPKHTGYNDTYKAYKIPPREMKEKEQYVPPATKFDARTTVGESFQGSYAPKRDSFKPENIPLHSDTPFDDSTTSKVGFPKHKVERRVVSEGRPYEQPQGRMDLQTTNELNFTVHPTVQREPLKKPSSSHVMRGEGGFVGVTRYTDDYTGRRGEKRETMKDQASWGPPAEPFVGQTTSNNDYQKPKLSPRESYRPQNVYVLPAVQFQGTTGYNDTYRAHKVTPREHRPKEEYMPPATKFDARTTVGDSFQGSYAPKRDSFKPENIPLHSETPFDDSTTSKVGFPKHNVEKRVVSEGRPYEQPQGRMDLQTTNELNFPVHPRVQREPLKKPSSSHVMRGEGGFVGVTRYTDDYTGRKGEKRETMKDKASWAPPAEKFEGETTSNRDYTNIVLTPRETFRPTNLYLRPTEPFDGHTNYGDTFHAHKITPREFRPKEEYSPPKAKLDTRTTFGEHYIGAQASKRESFKPDNAYQPSETPFNDVTTSKNDFRSHKPEKRIQHEYEKYRQPSGFMDLETTNKTTFTEHGRVERNTAKRPISSDIMKGHGEFDGSTHYSKDFLKHRPQGKLALQKQGSSHALTYEGQFDAKTNYGSDFIKPAKIDQPQRKPKEVYTSTTGKFQGESTTKSDFLGATSPRVASFKPISQPTASYEQFGSQPSPGAEKERSRWSQQANTNFAIESTG